MSSAPSPAGSEPPARETPYLGWVVAFIFVATLISFAWSGLKGARPVRVPNHLQPVSDVPDFRLLDQSGKPFGLSDLKGKIWIGNFVFTRGSGPVPMISARMAELNQKIGSAGEGVELVTFSVDPEFDTSDVLSAYAARLGAGPGRWKFLTGSKEEVDAIVIKGLLQPLEKKEPNGTLAQSTKFVIVDGKGRLRGFADGNDPEVVQKLLMDIGDLLRESGKQ
ncbi:MAG: SCO family protein [Verrucomicrobiaceae bacterium]|nr:MAG: SCO family protein [Verrucomicrobiaceae bacterium]